MKKYIILLLLFCTTLNAQGPYRILNSFNSGEMTPLLNAREDLAKFQSGCSVMENMIPIPQGGAQKRPGTMYVATAKDAAAVRLLPFQYSTSQSYALEFGNQYMREFTSNDVVYKTYGTEDLSSIGKIIAHWTMNDIGVDTVVLDDDDNTHDADLDGSTASALTTTDASGTANKALDLGDAQYIAAGDHNDFTFSNGTTDSSFSLAAWIYFIDDNANQGIISKWFSANQREWALRVNDQKLTFEIYDENANELGVAVAYDDLTDDTWYFVCATYNGQSGSNAGQGLKLYVDGARIGHSNGTDGSYVAMQNTTSDIQIGVGTAGGIANWNGKVDNVAVFNKELNEAEIASLTGTDSTTPAEIVTPYLTADLFELKFEQSADVLYISHPDYETRELSRLANSIWKLEVIDIPNGPFRVLNSDPVATISATVIGGGTLLEGDTVTLTALGHAPFVKGTTAGHLPSGTTNTSKSQTGALFKLIHPLDVLEYKEELESDFAAGQVEDTSWMDCGTVYKGGGWKIRTGDTWFGTISVQRNYTLNAGAGAGADLGMAVGWKTVYTYSSGAGAAVDASNISTTLRTEDDGDAHYRIIYEDEIGDDTVSVFFETDQTEQVGIVEIATVTSTTSATAVVKKSLGGASAEPTFKWAEGSWSNYRGFPQTVAFYEDRLIFGGNTSQPDTVWGSVTGDYNNMLAGADDADAVIFTLTSRQVNAIEWMVGKDKILIGTSGAEWTLSGSGGDPLTPSNVKAEQHSTYGSDNLQATLANESVLFFQRGAKRMRELAFNWEVDSYIAPDMTILAKEIAGDGITEMDFQQTPDGILWCIKEDGDIATFSYERKENVTAWSNQITDGDFESVAIINGSSEDQIWVSVQRDIGADTTARFIEYFSPRDFGSDIDDAYYVDAGITYDSTAITSLTGLDHLEGETVAILGDGAVDTSATVSGGAVTVASASTIQAGMPYTVQMRTMPLSWLGGPTIHGKMKKISEVISSWYLSGDFSIGKDADNLQTQSITGMTTDEDRVTFSTGWDRFGYVFVYQQSPEPLTLLALMIEFSLQ